MSNIILRALSIKMVSLSSSDQTNLPTTLQGRVRLAPTSTVTSPGWEEKDWAELTTGERERRDAVNTRLMSVSGGYGVTGSETMRDGRGRVSGRGSCED